MTCLLEWAAQGIRDGWPDINNRHILLTIQPGVTTLFYVYNPMSICGCATQSGLLVKWGIPRNVGWLFWLYSRLDIHETVICNKIFLKLFWNYFLSNYGKSSEPRGYADSSLHCWMDIFHIIPLEASSSNFLYILTIKLSTGVDRLLLILILFVKR